MQVGPWHVVINGSVHGSCYHWGVGRMGRLCCALSPRAEPREDSPPLHPTPSLRVLF